MPYWDLMFERLQLVQHQQAEQRLVSAIASRFSPNMYCSTYICVCVCVCVRGMCACVRARLCVVYDTSRFFERRAHTAESVARRSSGDSKAGPLARASADGITLPAF